MISRYNWEAVEPILKYLQAEGYEMVTLSELWGIIYLKELELNRSSGFFVCARDSTGARHPNNSATLKR